MNTLPTAIKAILNLIFFVIYILIGIFSENLLFGLVLTMLGKTIPASTDPIHMKLAILAFVAVGVVTVLFRKYFYLTVCIPKKVFKAEKKIISNISLDNKEGNITEDEMEILMDKEIK